MNELMNDRQNAIALLSLNDESDFLVDGRELHQKLGVETPYHKWFPRMCDYGFQENVDYRTKMSIRSDGLPGKMREDNELSLSMAKEICMLQRTQKGKEVRLYLIEIEKAWNSPDQVMARALKIADKTIANLTVEVGKLQEENAVQKQQIAEYQPKITYYDEVLKCRDAVPTSIIAKDYGWSATRLNKFLEENGVQYKLRGTWLLKQKYAGFGYTKSETFPFKGTAGNMHAAINTKWTQKGRLFIYELMKKNGNLPLIEQETLFQ